MLSRMLRLARTLVQIAKSPSARLTSPNIYHACQASGRMKEELRLPPLLMGIVPAIQDYTLPPPFFFYGGRGGTRTLAYMGYRAERLRIVAMYAGKEKKYYCKTSARNAIGKTWSYKNSTEERGPVGDK